jgi:hypothetical protein
VALGGRGRYGAAFALLDPLVRDPIVPGAIRAHAAITRASHLRQLGGHRWARRWDGLGLSLAVASTPAGRRSAPAAAGRAEPARYPDRTERHGADRFGADRFGADAAAARADATLGLAADALGSGELELAGRLLSTAERWVDRHPSWRPTVRLDWIRAELALAVDDPGRARMHAEHAAAVSRTAEAVRHEVKSELVVLVARSCEGESTYEALVQLSERASAARLYSLEWPIQLLLTRPNACSEGVRAADHRSRYHELLTSIRLASDSFGRMVLDRSPWVLVDSGG